MRCSILISSALCLYLPSELLGHPPDVSLLLASPLCWTRSPPTPGRVHTSSLDEADRNLIALPQVTLKPINELLGTSDQAADA